MKQPFTQEFNRSSRIGAIALFLLLALPLFLAVFVVQVYSEDLDSTTYKIKDFSFGVAGGEDQSSTNYRTMLSIGDPANDERLSSASYAIGYGTLYNWMANVPLIACFETITDGSTSCADADVNPDGMVMLCGDGGCYDRARFELDPQDNPTDALYSIQITTDSGWTTWDYVDGGTFLVETISTHDINDYLTENAWEGTASNFNILGLLPGETYYIRATALNSDFTESGAGPDVSTTLAYTQITFDLDIDGTSGFSSETASPYNIDFGSLDVNSATTAEDLVWIDINTNASSGLTVSIEDEYSGLFTSGYTIPSANADLDSVGEGYGLVEFSSAQNYLGPLAVTTDFGNGGNIVGGISSTPKDVYTTSGNPIDAGRASLYIKAKVGVSTDTGNYTDTITFRAIGSF